MNPPSFFILSGVAVVAFPKQTYPALQSRQLLPSFEYCPSPHPIHDDKTS